MIPVQQGTPVQEELDYLRVTLLGGYVQGCHAVTVTLIYYEGSLLRVEELAHSVETAVSGWVKAIFVVVLNGLTTTNLFSYGIWSCMVE